MRVSRRTILVGSVVLVTGCTGGNDDDSAADDQGSDGSGDENQGDDGSVDETDGDSSEEDTDGDATPGIELEYSIADPVDQEEVPDPIVEHPNPEDFQWIPVEIRIVNGELDVADIMGLTQIRRGKESHFTRGVVIHEDGTVITSEESHLLESEAEITAYYRTSADDITNPEWVVKQLENQHDELTVRQAD